MTKKIILFISSIGIISCKTHSPKIDYFGQTAPGTSPTIFGENLISKKGRFEHGISFSPDTKELVFGILDKNALKGNIYYSKKVNTKWTVPKNFEPLKNKSVFLPYFTPNGKSLLYSQSIPDTSKSYITNIWKLKKINGNWNSPKKIQSPLNSISREATASMTHDGTIYFSSNRNCLGKENCYAADLFYAKLTNNNYKNIKPVAKLNSSNDEESVFISPKEDYIIFCRYTNKETLVDLYISYRDNNNNWTTPQILDTTINSNDWDRRPFVSIDNNFLFFTRLKIEEYKLIESDIYWVATSKVFKPFIYNPITDKTLRLGKKFEIQIPSNYFKDIDNKQLTLRINQNELEWLKFDPDKLKITGTPTLTGNFELIFTATDQFSNITQDKIKITVTK